MLYRFSAFMLFFIFLTFCSSSKPNSQQKITSEIKPEKYKAAAEAQFKNNIQYRFNKDKSCVLCVKTIKLPNDPGQFKLSFILYDLRNDEIIFEASHPNAKVKWISTEQIQVFLTPGIVSLREDKEKTNYGYIYDTKIRKKVSNNLQRKDN